MNRLSVAVMLQGPLLLTILVSATIPSSSSSVSLSSISMSDKLDSDSVTLESLELDGSSLTVKRQITRAPGEGAHTFVPTDC